MGPLSRFMQFRHMSIMIDLCSVSMQIPPKLVDKNKTDGKKGRSSKTPWRVRPVRGLSLTEEWEGRVGLPKDRTHAIRKYITLFKAKYN